MCVFVGMFGFPSMTVLRVIPITLCISRMLPLWYVLFHHINAVQLFHCTVDEPLGYSPFLPIMRKAAVNLLIRI